MVMAQNNLSTVTQLLSQASTILGNLMQTSSASSTSMCSFVQTPNSTSNLRTTPEPQRTPTPARTCSERSTVLSELRRNFEPYNGRTMRRRSEVGRPTEQPQQWSHRFFCLDSPEVAVTPNRRDVTFLSGNGLGSTVVVAARRASSDQLSEALRQAYPILEGVEFELLQSVGGGGGAGKPLRRITAQHQVPSVSTLLQARVLSVIYIRPLVQLTLPVEESTGSTSSADAQNTESNSSGESSNTTAGSTSHHPNEDHIASHDGLVTMEDLRAQVYLENPGMQLIAVQRDEFALQILGSYKDPNMNLLQQPHVVFIGEPGRDVGALTKEYFWRGIESLRVLKANGLPLFEGEEDHILPAADASLLRSGYYKELGKFLGHSVLHTGVGFHGFSPAVIDYLCIKRITLDTPITIDAADIPYYNTRLAVQAIEQWRTDTGGLVENLDMIEQSAREAGFNERVVHGNRLFAREQMLYHYVVEKRRAQLDSLREGFMFSPAFDFLCSRPYLQRACFPSMNDLNIPKHIFLEQVECEGENSTLIKQYLAEFIETLDQQGIRELLACWTGFGQLPSDGLKLKAIPACTFNIRTCFTEIQVPTEITKDDFHRSLRMAITYASSGFGSA